MLVDVSSCVAAVGHRNFYIEVEHSNLCQTAFALIDIALVLIDIAFVLINMAPQLYDALKRTKLTLWTGENSAEEVLLLIYDISLWTDEVLL